MDDRSCAFLDDCLHGMMHIIYAHIRCLVFSTSLCLVKPTERALGLTTMATIPPVGTPLSASPAAQSIPDPGLPTGVAAQGTATPGPSSDGGVAAAQSKPEVPGDSPISHDAIPTPPVSNA